MLLITATQFANAIESVHAATRKTLLKVKGFSEVKVEKIKEAISKLQVRPPYSSDRSYHGIQARNMLTICSEPAFSIWLHHSR